MHFNIKILKWHILYDIALRAGETAFLMRKKKQFLFRSHIRVVPIVKNALIPANKSHTHQRMLHLKWPIKWHI